MAFEINGEVTVKTVVGHTDTTVMNNLRKVRVIRNTSDSTDMAIDIVRYMNHEDAKAPIPSRSSHPHLFTFLMDTASHHRTHLRPKHTKCINIQLDQIVCPDKPSLHFRDGPLNPSIADTLICRKQYAVYIRVIRRYISGVQKNPAGPYRHFDLRED